MHLTSEQRQAIEKDEAVPFVIDRVRCRILREDVLLPLSDQPERSRVLH